MKIEKKLSDDEIIEEIKAIWPTLKVEELITHAKAHNGAGNCLRQLIEQTMPMIQSMAEENNEPCSQEDYGKLLVAAGAAVVASARHHEAQKDTSGPRFELPADPFKGRVSFN